MGKVGGVVVDVRWQWDPGLNGLLQEARTEGTSVTTRSKLGHGWGYILREGMVNSGFESYELNQRRRWRVVK